MDIDCEDPMDPIFKTYKFATRNQKTMYSGSTNIKTLVIRNSIYRKLKLIYWPKILNT